MGTAKAFVEWLLTSPPQSSAKRLFGKRDDFRWIEEFEGCEEAQIAILWERQTTKIYENFTL